MLEDTNLLDGAQLAVSGAVYNWILNFEINTMIQSGVLAYRAKDQPPFYKMMQALLDSKRWINI